MSDQTEQELFRRARTGDRIAFDRLQTSLDPLLRRFVRRLIGCSDAEEDVVRTTLFALYVNLERIEPPENLRPFLFRIVRNLCYKELRRQGRFRPVSLDSDTDAARAAIRLLKDDRAQPDEAVHWMMLYSQVQQAMESLPEAHRQTMILYGETGLSYAQVAEAMATDIGTVKSRLHYARKSLARRLPPDVREALGIDREGNNARRKH